MRDIAFTDRELDLMSVLWRRGSGTVAEVREALRDELAYTTVLTVLQTLEDKGHVRHEEEGRAYRYFPLVEAGRAGDSALRRILDTMFEGSAARLFAHLVAGRDLDRAELDRMRELLDERLRTSRRSRECGADGADPGSSSTPDRAGSDPEGAP
jgi:predicted transcriptional regulator